MVREVKLNIMDMIGKPVTFEGREVGHIVDIQGCAVTCAIDSDIANQVIRSDKRSFSLEVVRR